MAKRRMRSMNVPIVPIAMGLAGMSIVSGSAYGGTPLGQATNTVIGLGMLRSVSRSNRWF